MKKCPICGMRASDPLWTVCPICGAALVSPPFKPVPLNQVTESQKIQIFDKLYDYAMEIFENRDEDSDEEHYAFEKLMSILLLDDESRERELQLWEAMEE